MSKQLPTIILYPDLQMEYDNSSCTVNCIYNELHISEKDCQKINIKKYTPNEIQSIQDFYSLLSFLNEKSGKQSVVIPKGKKSIFLLLLIIGIPLCVIPPLGLFLMIYGVCGLFGVLKKTITPPRIKVTSTYSSPKDTEILNKLTEMKPVLNSNFNDEIFNNVFGIKDDKDKVFENIDFDDGSKLLLFAYSVVPHYEKHWEHETKDGQPDSRYKNNPSYQSISYYSIKLMVPGKLYDYEHVMNFEYEQFMQEVQQLDQSIEIKTIKLGTDNSNKIVNKIQNT